MKLHHHHFEQWFLRPARDPVSFLGPIRWIAITRDDKVAQAVAPLELAPDRVVFEGPLVVLMNHDSSGAAEIVVSALRHAKREYPP